MVKTDSTNVRVNVPAEDEKPIYKHICLVDEQGRLIKEGVYLGDLNLTRESYQYDDQDRLVYSQASNEIGNEEEFFEFGDGYWTQRILITDKDGSKEFNYKTFLDADGRPTKIQRDYGDWRESNFERTVDGNGDICVKEIIVGKDNSRVVVSEVVCKVIKGEECAISTKLYDSEDGTSLLRSTEYEHDEDGKLISMHVVDEDESYTEYYTYDDQNRLIKVERPEDGKYEIHEYSENGKTITTNDSIHQYDWIRI